jgi:hypothetical protein
VTAGEGVVSSNAALAQAPICHLFISPCGIVFVDPCTQFSHLVYPSPERPCPQAAMMCKLLYEGDMPQLRLLLRAGASPNVQDYDQQTPLHIAAADANLPAVRRSRGAQEGNPQPVDSLTCITVDFPLVGHTSLYMVL